MCLFSTFFESSNIEASVKSDSLDSVDEVDVLIFDFQMNFLYFKLEALILEPTWTEENRQENQMV